MGMGPVPALRRVLARADLRIHDMDVIELNEALAAQGLAVLRQLDVADDAPHVNPNGGGIAIGHPLGASGGPVARNGDVRAGARRRTRRARAEDFGRAGRVQTGEVNSQGKSNSDLCVR